MDELPFSEVPAEPPGPPVGGGPRWPLDPAHPVCITITVFAVLISMFMVLVAHMPAGPLDLLYEPVRSLAVVSQVDRLATEGDTPFDRVMQSLPGASADDVRDRDLDSWVGLIADLDDFDPVEAERARKARDVVAAAWGDLESHERVIANTDAIPQLPTSLIPTARKLASAEAGQPIDEADPAGSAVGLAWLLVGIQFAVILGGLSILGVWLIRQRPDVRLRERASFGTFDLGRGLTIFIWMFALGAILQIGLVVPVMVFPALTDVIWESWLLLAFVPLAVAVWWMLLQPQSIRLAEGLGLTAPRGGLFSMMLIVMAALGLDLGFELVFGVAFAAMGEAAPWHLFVSEPILFGPTWLGSLSGLNMCLGAPLYEELLFRGVLYTALRHRLPVFPAALISAFVFSAAHWYGWAGSIFVTFSGIVLALVYERTNSLLPCIILHGLMNLFVVGTLLMYRLAV